MDCGEVRSDRRGRGEDAVAIAIEAIEIGLDLPPQEAEAIISKIGLEPGVQAGDGRNGVAPGPVQRLPAEQVGRGQMHDVRLERLQIGAGGTGQADREPIFRATGNAERAHRSDIAGRGEGRRRRGRRIDAHLCPMLVQHMPNQAVERPVRAIAHAIIIARKQRDLQRPG